MAVTEEELRTFLGMTTFWADLLRTTVVLRTLRPRSPRFDSVFTLHTDASALGAAAILTLIHYDGEGAIAYANNIFSRTNANHGATRANMSLHFG